MKKSIKRVFGDSGLTPEERVRWRVSFYLSEAADASGLSDKQIAKRLGVSLSWVSRLLNGQLNPKIERVATVADALGYVLNIEIIPRDTGDGN